MQKANYGSGFDKTLVINSLSSGKSFWAPDADPSKNGF
jgi:hypothetical protein